MTASPILFVGVGKLGRPIAERMMARGLQLHVADVNPEASAYFANRGTTVAPLDQSPLRYTRVVLCLPEPSTVTAQLRGWTRHQLPDGALIADITTMPPGTAKTHAAMVAAAGGEYLDTPVSRSNTGSDDAVIAASGSRTAFDTMQPILSAIGSTVHYLGDSGAASQLKAINQYLYLSYNFVFAQGVKLGRELGLPDEVLWDALSKGAAGHPLISERLASTRQSGFREGFILKRCLKDLDCLETGADFASRALDAYRLMHQTISESVERGLGDRDILALAEGLT